MPPLPRNGSNTATPTMATFPSGAIMGENSGYHPNSPPQSYPGSPEQSTRSSTSTTHSNPTSIWQRRSVEHPSPLADTIAKFMLTEDDEYMAPPPIMQRAHSHSAAAGQTFQQTVGTLPSTLQSNTIQPNLVQPNSTQPNPTQLPTVVNRMRSQSSPNIQAIQEWEGTETLPDLPNSTNVVRTIASNVFHSTGTQQRDSGSSTSSRTSVQSAPNAPINSAPTNNAPTNSAPSPPNGHTNGHQHSLSNFSTTMKIKVNYADDIFVIVVPQDIEYRELCDRVERKIRLCSTRRDESIPIRIKYQDEDSDYITINSDEDVLMAFEGRLAAGGNFVNLYVS
ncbi:564_t:CDS:1 [Diversispora eburnea]|uniref:564_t:CDS:1 n=1 Tax=Diversispora eburnea TaxID=1213867 RepID=A0A9N9F541_9GLOM|nr:564_t:CDS:1 [Diversispora eburnea]